MDLISLQKGRRSSPTTTVSGLFMTMSDSSEFRPRPTTRPGVFWPGFTRNLVFILFMLRLGAVEASSDESPPDTVGLPLTRRQVAVPIASDFIFRVYHDTVLIGNYLYIEGGNFGQYVNGAVEPELKRKNNDTLYIDMSKDWTNSSVEIKTVYKDDTIPKSSWPGLWPKGDDSFLFWAGESISNNYSQGLWQFTANSTGGGTWASADPGDARSFHKLTRPSVGLVAATNTTGYYLGGDVSSFSDSDLDGDQRIPISGLISYNWESKQWKNDSTFEYTPLGTAIHGKIQHLPDFGTQGVLLMLGGIRSSDREGWDFSSSPYLDFTNLTIYDIATKSWHWQRTSASWDTPDPRVTFCIVGAASLNNTFEIFLYGGIDQSRARFFDDIHVLSLPAFRWFRISLNTTGIPRSSHSCNRVANQMVVVGGYDLSKGGNTSLTDSDPWLNGLGVFDLTDLKWKSSYNASASAYDSPQMVKDWYNEK
ncbi:hypothetical protein HDK77DRAFT_224807 [Phyllosticta capitalensis]